MSNSQDSKTSLNYNDTYPCPVCRQGEISTLPLMEAFACNICRHIFTANLEQQILKMADSQIPLAWRWTGRHWQGVQRQGGELSWGYWMAGMAFIALPTLIVGSGAYLFPPLPGSPLAWFPRAWTILTLVSHLLCIAWLVLEYYQFPLMLYLRASAQRFLPRS